MDSINPNVVIIIVNWNGKKNTLDCLKSLYALDYPSFEIIVVDNASTDGSIDCLKQFYPNIRYLQSDINLGWTGGCALGMKCALNLNCKYIFILNNDIIIDKDCLRKLVNVAESNTKIGFVGPRICSYYGPQKIESPGINRNYLTLEFEKNRKFDDGSFQDIRQVNYLDDMALLVRREVILTIGMHDLDYFMYGEDVDWSYRVHKGGFLLVYVPFAIAKHKHHASTGGKYNAFIAYYQSRNYLLFFRKNFRRNDFIQALPYFLKFVMYQSSLALRYGQWDIPLAIIKGILWHIKDILL